MKHIGIFIIFCWILTCIGCKTKSLNKICHQKGLTSVRYEKKLEHLPITLVKNANANAQIVVSSTDNTAIDASLKLSAVELQSFVKKSTGALLPIINEKDYKGGNFILLGTGKMTKSLQVNVDDLKPEGFRIKSFPTGIVIAGRDTGIEKEIGYKYSNFGEQGTLWGVYEFLERFVGIRWYFPGEIGTSIPKRKDLIILPIAIKDWPNIVKRELYPSLYPIARRLRHGRSTRLRTICHTPIWDKVYKKSHPEYFSLKKDGSRDFQRKCYSNLEMRKQFMKDLTEYYEKGNSESWGKYWFRPDEYMIPISPSDYPINCQCERCKKLFVQNSESPASEIIGDFINDIALKVKKNWPRKKIVFLAYSNYLLPPKVNFPSNVEIIYACTRSLANYNEPRYRNFDQKAIDAWYKRIKRPLSIWHYPCYPDEFIRAPFFFPHLISNFHKRNKGKINGVFLNGTKEWHHMHLNNYIWMKCLWNPDFNVDDAIEDYCIRMYGDAHGEIYEIVTILTERWEKTPRKILPNPYYKISLSHVYEDIYPEQIVGKIKDLFNKAKSKVKPGSISSKRLDYFGNALKEFFNEADSYYKEKEFEKDKNTIALFHFNENNINEINANNNKIDIQKDITHAHITAFGRFNNAISLYAESGIYLINVPYSSKLTIEAWICPHRPLSNQPYRYIFFSGSPSNGYGIMLDKKNRLILKIKNQIHQTDCFLKETKWIHFAIQLAKNQITLLVNKKIIKKLDAPDIVSQGIFSIGIPKNSKWQGFSGAIDELRISDILRYQNNSSKDEICND